MSPKLPVVSGQQAVRVFRRLGYEVTRQRGSHFGSDTFVIQLACH